MSQFKVKLQDMNAALDEMEALSSGLQQGAEDVRGIRDSLRMQIRQRARINSQLMTSARDLDSQYKLLKKIIAVGRDAARLYLENEERLANMGLEVSEAGRMPDGESGLFDDEGGYGGDQGEPARDKAGWRFLFWRFGEDNDLIDFVRSYDQYKDYSKHDVAKLYDQINEEGCGYVAAVNSIFLAYEGHEDAFLRDFGFPMYDENGEFNYNRLLIDFYASTDDKYFLDQPDGVNALVNDRLLRYEGKEKEFREIYGVDLWEDNDPESGCWNEEAMQKILDEYNDMDMAEFKFGGTTLRSLNNRLSQYLEDKGVTYENTTIRVDDPLTGDQIKDYLDDGKSVNIGIGGFNLYDENGNMEKKNVGGHWMTITGVTEDGNYIVSSWGKKYYVHPDELTGRKDYLINEIGVSDRGRARETGDIHVRDDRRI